MLKFADTLKLMQYPGTKNKQRDNAKIPVFFNSLVRDLDVCNYNEPFLGSGAIFLNLDKEYNYYTLSDLDKDLIDIWKAVRIFSPRYIMECVDGILKYYGDIVHDKDAYLKFRNEFNTRYYKTNDAIRGVYLLLLVNTAANGYFRFGPKGFNVPSGQGRYFNPGVDGLKTINDKLYYNCELKCADYRDVVSACTDQDLIFLDPPYGIIPAKDVSYKHKFGMDDQKELLELINNSKAKIVYTDILTDQHKEIIPNWNRRSMADLGSQLRDSSPSGSCDVILNECIFWNF